MYLELRYCTHTPFHLSFILISQLQLDHIDTTGREGSLRGRKIYKIAPTPLTSLIWWRICLDEAQMVVLFLTLPFSLYPLLLLF
jgi:hypothetical protein